MSDRFVSWLLHAAIFILFFCIGFMSSRSCRQDTPQPREVVRVDTLIVFDTIVKNKPIYITKVAERVDTVRLTTVERDTVAAVIPIERKVYAEDSLYRAVVTGYLASLDSLVIFPKTTTITTDRTIYVQPRKWSFGVTAGPAVLVAPSGRMHAGAGIAVGVSCRF